LPICKRPRRRCIESCTAGSGLTSRGNGYYEYDFKTQESWAGKCGTLTVTAPHNGARAAVVKFKK
jgi:hypothetical protein